MPVCLRVYLCQLQASSTIQLLSTFPVVWGWVGWQGLSLELTHSAGLADHQDSRILCFFLPSLRIPGMYHPNVQLFTLVPGILTQVH